MDYDKLTKEELISLLRELESKRAFSYEDCMKLEILDQSPFTIWASNRDCKIMFWDGQCEHHYGYTREQAIGRDYVDLFVDEDEKAAARDDQLKIIDHGEVFHNIANDHGRDGNILHLITNCRRIRDIKTGEFWNAEMGLIIDYIEDEKERLNQVISESRKVKSCVSQFIASVNQDREQFADRKKAINSSIRTYESIAISRGKRRDFKKSIAAIHDEIKEIEGRLNTTIERYFDQIQLCRTYDSCEQTRLEFMNKYAEILDCFEDVVLDIKEIAQNLHCSSSVVSGRDGAMRDAGVNNRWLINYAHDLLMRAESEITEYRGISAKSNSTRMQRLVERRDRIQSIKDKIDEFVDNIYHQLGSAETDESVQSLRVNMEKGFKAFEVDLKKIKEEMD